MITKENLIGMLEKALANEDEFIISYGKDFLDNIMESEILNNEEKKEIEGLLSALLKDTERHKKTIELLIEKVKEDQRNEF
ncbi:MAG: hypothetical protein JSW17_05300 [Candidatus Omnitrophota bacterium]|nr:MAG: hypothetical protein JSW17_05300 [Candidatus Omnitrophota bacterium]